MAEPGVITTEPMTVAYIPMRGPYDQTPQGYARLYTWVEAHGLRPAGMPAAAYLTSPAETPESDARWELWAPVAEGAETEPDDAGIGVKRVPATTVASTMHVGPYDTIPATYEELGRWVALHGYEVDGPPMERYYSDPNEVPPEEYRTEVLLPVRQR